MNKEHTYILIGDEGINYEINIGKDKDIIIMNLEAIIDSVVDTFKSYYGMDASELIENIKRDVGLDDEDVKEIGEDF